MENKREKDRKFYRSISEFQYLAGKEKHRKQSLESYF